MKIFIANDHAGYELKCEIVEFLKDLGYEVFDLGTNNKTSVDYPDFADILAQKLAGEYAKNSEQIVKTIEIYEKNGKNVKNFNCFGILICGSGIGISIAANRHTHIRAALCDNELYARLSREHNDANVLCLGGRLVGVDRAKSIVQTFLKTEFSQGIRHQNRIKKLF